MKILITGGLGFVGSHLADSLSRSHEILILTKSFSKKNNLRKSSKKIKIQKCDVTKPKILGRIIEKFRPNIIVHLAGNASHAISFEKPFLDIDSNLKSTLIILEKIRELNLPCKFILGSTFIVIGRPEKLPVDENSPCRPTSIYGTTRLASEHLCQIYHHVYGLKTNIFRITNSFGPREQIIPTKNAVNFLIYQSFKQKKILIYNNGDLFRDLLYIDDVISGIRTIIRNGKPGELYWIASGKKFWFKDLAKLLQKLNNCKVIYPETPKYTKKVDVGNFHVDNSKLKKLGWYPKFSVEKGVIKTQKFFKVNDF